MEYKPHEYQRHCIEEIIQKPALALWLDMGLGKTVIVLQAIARLKYDYFNVGKVLIVAPKKVAEATWQLEAQKWDGLRFLRLSTVLGTTKQRIAALCKEADVYIINRDNVAWLVDYYRNDWPFDMVVLDESSSFKNSRSIRFKKMRSVMPHINRMVELTGTPSPQGLMDLWAQVFLLDGGARLGTTMGKFRDLYFAPDKRSRDQVFTYKPREGGEQEVKELLQDICISMKAEDYLQLPDMILHDVPVVLDNAASKRYKELERDSLLALSEDVAITAGMAATLTNKLLQLCNGAVYDEDHAVHEIHSCKIEAFVELLEQLAGQPVLVFYNFKHDCIRILQALGKTKLRVKAFSGPDDAAAWNEGNKIDVLLAHPASCAYGLNLQQGGHHIVWFGLNWSLELVEQANARLHRQGQTQPVIVHRLIVQGGVDEDVIQALECKSDVQERLLASLKARVRRISGV